jgi:hypothetical protein
VDREATGEIVVYGDYPLLEKIVRYVADAVVANVIVVFILSFQPRRRPSERPTARLMTGLMLALLACIVARDLLRWRQSGWTIHFAIHGAAFFGGLVLAILGHCGRQTQSPTAPRRTAGSSPVWPLLQNRGR